MENSIKGTELSDFKLIKNYLHSMLCHYLEGNFEEAKMWQRILRACNDKTPDLFHLLDRFDIKRLKTISYALDNNQYATWLYDKDSEEVVPPVKKKDIVETQTYEKDIVKILIRNENAIARASGFRLKIATIEQETRYGNIDIMAYSKLFAHPIEVKLDMATHAIVGQILKYMKHYLFRLNYGFFRDVIGIIIAKRYSDTAYQELKKHNVVMLEYAIVNDQLTLRKI
jgi:hypothetical protein